MAISRFDRNTAYDWNFNTYVPKEFIPNFEAWDSLLS